MAKVEWHKLKFIVADDYSSFRSTVSTMLSRLGVIQIESVASGKEVLQLCQGKRYDVILCDYDLKQGKNGQQVLEELRHRDLLPRGSLFIMVTADSSRSVVMSAYDCEPDDYLMKPITAQTLEQRLTRVLQRRLDMMPIYRALDSDDLRLASTLLAAKASGKGRTSAICQKLLGELLLQQGEYGQAAGLYSRVLKTQPVEWARLGLAKVKRAEGDSETALEWLNALTEANPFYLPAYDELAEILREQGDNQALQKTIQKAVDVSPMSILRQQKLGEVAERNQDLSCAVKAFRRSIRLGQQSCHARPQDSFGFARAVAASREQGLEQETALTTEALAAINAARERFSLPPEQLVRAAVLQGRVQAALGRGEDARAALAAVDPANLDPADLELSIDMVAALRKLGDSNQADQLLNKLLVNHKHDQRALEQLDLLLDEPVSESNRRFVAQTNREGIQLYEQKRFDEAIERFEQAVRLFPNNVGLQLNIAQALLGKSRTAGADDAVHEDFSTAMSRIENLIATDHPQYERYCRLQALAKAKPKGETKA